MVKLSYFEIHYIISNSLELFLFLKEAIFKKVEGRRMEGRQRGERERKCLFHSYRMAGIFFNIALIKH